jgi:ankyrin repeat protein
MFFLIFQVLISRFSQTPFSDAILKDQFEDVKRLYNEDRTLLETPIPDRLTYHQPKFYSPLTLAVSTGSFEMVTLLIELNVDLNKTERRMNHFTGSPATPLLYAVFRRDLNFVKLLVDYGANINKYISYQQSPLIWSVFLKQPAISKFLVESGAFIDQHASWAIAGSREIMRELLDYQIRFNYFQKFSELAEWSEKNPEFPNQTLSLSDIVSLLKL